MTKQLKGKLLIIRHGESLLNAKGIWTGQTDTTLTEKGKADARKMGEAISDLKLKRAFTSSLKRTHETLDHVLQGHGATNLSRTHHPELNERHYGTLTGKNKWEVKEEVGEEAFNGIRRHWDYPVPEGETLKDVHDRAVPFYLEKILPQLEKDSHIVLVGHGNTIRALMKHFENVHEDDIASVEMPFGTILVYDLDENGKALNKEVRTVDITPSNA